MKTVEHPLVVAYLDSVAREAADLPTEHRSELLADLTEHISVTLAGQSRSEAEVKNVLDRLGDPRTIVATAREGETTSAPASRHGRTLAPVVLFLLVAVPGVGMISMFAGLVLLWTTPRWSRRDKIIGTILGAAIPLVAGLALVAFAMTVQVDARVLLSYLAVVAVASATASVHLFRARRRMAS